MRALTPRTEYLTQCKKRGIVAEPAGVIFQTGGIHRLVPHSYHVAFCTPFVPR